MTPVRKVVIPAAGWGTRFLPTTKAVPKELIPLIDRPVIQYGLEEASASGLSHAVIVTSPGKRALEEYFAPRPDLDRFLESKGSLAIVRGLEQLIDSIEFSYVVQKEQLGLGHAIMTATEAVGQEPFAVLLPDDVIQSKKPVLRQMMEVFEVRQRSVLAVEKIPRERISGYGIIDAQEIGSGLYRVKGLVEKPQPEDAPSDLGIVGRYILTPGLFDALEKTSPGALGEIQVTDGIAKLLETEPVYAYEFQGDRHDAGTPLGLIKASVSMALSHPDLGPEVRTFLADLYLES